MAITNQTEEVDLTTQVRLCSSLFCKIRGLMFSSRLEDEGLVMRWSREGKRDLHMWWVFFPIDILWLDQEGKVLQLRERARPFTFLIRGPERASTVIELPAGTLERTRTKTGDIIIFS